MPDVFMPRLSDTMEEGTIAQWVKSEGDEVQRGDVLAEIETDKAVMDLEAYESGVLEKIIIQAGETVPIGEAIAVIGDGSGTGGGSGDAGQGGATDEDQGQAVAEAENAGAEDTDSQGESDEADQGTGENGGADQDRVSDQDAGGSDESEESAPPARGDGAAAPASDAKLKASPVVRSLAKQHGIDLSGVTGTGPGGRIIRVDVEKLLESGTSEAASEAARSAQAPTAASTAPAGSGDERVPLSTIRKVTAKRLSEAALIPAFQLTTILDATNLTALRKQINDQLASTGTKISVTDLLVRAAAVALRAHPEVNASFDGDAIIRRGRVNVGIAVALDDGLIVPVVKDADRKTVSQIGTEAKDLASRARAGKLKPEEFSGGTFTISNLGMFGIDNFTAVLNPPEAAILAVGSTAEEPVVIDGDVQVRARTRLTLTVDHRVLDGAMGAAFLRDLTDILTEPMRLLV